MGKAIAIYNPILNSVGSTTTSISLSGIFSWYALKKTLILDLTESADLEKHINISTKYTLDFLRSYDEKLDCEVIQMHSTSLNHKLDIIGGYTLDKSIIGDVKNFEILLIEEAKKKYDYVIVDLSNTYKDYILEKADYILPILPFDAIQLDRLEKREFKGKEICIFSRIAEELEEEIQGIALQYKIDNYVWLPLDADIQYYSGISKNLYKYIEENINSRNTYMDQVKEINYEILKRDFPDAYEENTYSWKDIFRMGGKHNGKRAR